MLAKRGRDLGRPQRKHSTSLCPSPLPPGGVYRLTSLLATRDRCSGRESRITVWLPISRPATPGGGRGATASPTVDARHLPIVEHVFSGYVARHSAHTRDQHAAAPRNWNSRRFCVTSGRKGRSILEDTIGYRVVCEAGKRDGYVSIFKEVNDPVDEHRGLISHVAGAHVD